MMKIIGCLYLVLVVFAAGAQSTKKPGISRWRDWYRKYPSLNSVNLQPDESIDQQQFARQYSKSKKWWDEAFAYLKKTNLSSLTPGNYPIDGEDVFVKVTEAVSKDVDSSKWESHHHYHDIHYVINGKEMIGITPVSEVTPTTAYDSSRDILFYTGFGPYFLAAPDRFFIIFSNQAHRPFIKVGGYEQKVKRIVIKVRNPDAKGLL
jgi:biofilm protein TabA